MTYRCIKPLCDPLDCVGCNCAIPEDVARHFDALRKDAERYRWLRNTDNWTQEYLIVNEFHTRFTSDAALDAAIDRDIAAGKAKP